MKKLVYTILLSVIGLVLSGCSSAGQGKEMTIYYVSAEENALVQEEYKLMAETTEEQIKEVMAVLMDADHNVNYHSAIPEGIIAEQFRLRDRQVDLIFSEGYAEIPKAREVLLRAAVVQTLVQIPDIQYVSFYIGEQPLTTLSGEIIGLMRAEDFVQNTGSALKTYQTTDLKLYFSNTDGTALDIEKRSGIHYGSNMSIEKLVVEQLMKGTTSDKRTSTIPNNAKLLGVSVKEGVCYVNFDSSFLGEGFNQTPEVTIYSIVNSIIVNGNATKVQILVEGSSDVKFKGTFDLNRVFEWNAEIIGE